MSDIVIIDYGMGNLRSVQKAFQRVGYEAEITSSPQRVLQATAVVLPGVGAFGEAMANLRRAGLADVLRRTASDRPFLGICLGQQLLFDESEEMGQHEGLGILPGKVLRFGTHNNGESNNSAANNGSLKVPHMGWNQMHIVRPSSLFDAVSEGDFVYFVHSYYVAPADPELILATTDYGVSFASIVGRGQLWGIQFHPEKSQRVGLAMLANFARLT